MSQAFFVGGLEGKRKTDGQPFYILNFGAPSTRSNIFGFEAAQVFTDEKTFADFKRNARPGKEVNATLHYSRGGWDLIEYKF